MIEKKESLDPVRKHHELTQRYLDLIDHHKANTEEAHKIVEEAVKLEADFGVDAGEFRRAVIHKLDVDREEREKKKSEVNPIKEARERIKLWRGYEGSFRKKGSMELADIYKKAADDEEKKLQELNK